MCIFREMIEKPQLATKIFSENWINNKDASIIMGISGVAKRKSWLTQQDIDRPEESTKQFWLEGVPGGFSTLMVLVAFLAGIYGTWLIWQLSKQ